MAYGFLRRVFEVFERFRTAVDVVTTSEVSVSVTVDDRRNLDAIVEALSEFAEVSIEPEMALLCAVGDRLQDEPEIAARVVGVLEEVPLQDDLAGRVAAGTSPWCCGRRSAARDAAAARGVLRHEAAHRRLREDGPAGRGAGRRQGHRDRRAAWTRGATSGGRPMSRWTSRRRTRCWRTFARYVERRLPVVIGTTGWASTLDAARRGRAGRPRRRRVGRISRSA